MKLACIRLGPGAALVEVDELSARVLVIDTQEPWFDPLRAWLYQDKPTASAEVAAFHAADLLAPVKAPSKIIAIGLNYRDHAAEQKRELPKAPMLFTKAPSSIAGPNDEIVFSTAASDKVDYENELGVVIGRRCRNISEADALDYVLGYTICNDVSARDAQRTDGQFFRAKSFDTFCPVGPYIVTSDEISDPQALAMRTYVNDELRQNSNTSDMIFGVAESISYISKYLTLEPGDIISTGTPAGVGEAMGQFLQNGDVVRCEIDGLGVLQNTVRATD